MEPQNPFQAVPETPAPAPAPAPPSQTRARVLIALGAVLSIAIGAGAGTYVVKQRQHRNDQAIAAAEAAMPAKPKPLTGGVRSDGEHYGSLFAFLLPIPSGYTPGPYDTMYGDNSYVPAKQITSQLEDLLSGFPKSDISSAKGALASTHLKGVAVRTIEQSQGTDAMTASIELIQYDVKYAKTAAGDFKTLVSDLNIFRNGAAVPGYGQAKCVLPPGLGSDKVDEMLCVASSGDVEVLVDAEGTIPLNQNEVAQLVQHQLDRLKAPQTIDGGGDDD